NVTSSTTTKLQQEKYLQNDKMCGKLDLDAGEELAIFDALLTVLDLQVAYVVDVSENKTVCTVKPERLESLVAWLFLGIGGC
ncbi:16864_t:CDS:2, partial [Acaulospora colombiana]